MDLSSLIFRWRKQVSLSVGGRHAVDPNARADITKRTHGTIARNAKGFIYLVSVTGVTGARTSISDGLGDLIARVREHTSVPVCVGFGIGTPEQAKQVGALADGVIVGSACVKTIGESENPVEAARKFARDLAAPENNSQKSAPH